MVTSLILSMSLNLPQSMNAQFTNLVDGQFTPIIDRWITIITVEFSLTQESVATTDGYYRQERL